MSSRLTFAQKEIENRISHFRGTQVMLDSDLAKIYPIETRVMNQAANRNIARFPELFRFTLNEAETEDWKSQVVMSSAHKGR